MSFGALKAKRLTIKQLRNQSEHTWMSKLVYRSFIFIYMAEREGFEPSLAFWNVQVADPSLPGLP